jgi:dihydrofolate synthase/folylpolyglutamate synthase
VTAAERYIDSLELFGMAFGLERMHDLLGRLDNPERSFDAIHVVGTNGKGSTVLFAEALLEAEGVRTGAYLSPHITSFRERIRVGGAEVGPAAYEEAVLRVRDAAGTRVTQFEAVTAAAFCAFAAAGVEWGVVEAGLGGRLDATNVLPRSRVQVLTNVSLEHTQLLGSTREAIAAEKLAVVPDGGLLVVGEPKWAALAPQAAKVEAVRAEGTYQDQNRAVARAAVELALGRRVDPAAMLGLRIPGRMEVRGHDPLEVWDGAHNVAGMVELLSGVCDVVVATQSTNPRVLPAAELAAITGGEFEPDPGRARERAIELSGRGGAVIVCGSLYLLHDLISRPHGVEAARSPA